MTALDRFKFFLRRCHPAKAVKELNRRVTVEQALLDYANGKRELSRDEARDLGLFLGDPTYVRRFK